MAKIASGGITLTSVEDPFMVHSTNPSFVIKENYDGSEPQLSEAYTNITCGKGDTKLKFSISLQSCTSADINYKTEFSSDGYTLKLSIISIPATITGGSITLTLTSGDSSQDVLTSFSTIRETATLDWIKDWNTRRTQIGSEYIVTPKIFAGAVSEDRKVSGVYLGPDPNDTTNSGCILGYKSNDIVFKLGNEGNFIGGWNIGKSSLISGGISINSSDKSICVGPGTATEINDINRIKEYGGVYIYHTSDTDYGIAGYNSGDKQTFRLGNENKIAGWNFDEEAIWIGTKGNTNGVLLESDGITIGTNGLRGKGWRIEKDGVGSLALDHIVWDKEGNVVMSGSITTESGKIGGWNITKVGINTTNVFFYSTGQLIHTEGTTVFWELAANGSGILAKGNVKWDETGAGSIAGGAIVWNTDGSGSVAKGKISWTDKGDCSFDGKVTSSSGKIGGWTISDTKISNSNIVIDSEGEIACVVVSTTDKKVAWSLQEDGTGVLAFGNITWDEYGAGSLANGNITWTEKGACTFKGEITAASGTIAGWTIGESALTGGNVTLSKDGTISNVNGDVTYWKLNTDGSGVLAKNNIAWDVEGSVTLKNISAVSGSIGPFVISSDAGSMTAYSSDNTEEMLLSSGLISFLYNKTDVKVYIGSETPKSFFGELYTPINIYNHRIPANDNGTKVNAGIVLDVGGTNMFDKYQTSGNHAIVINHGDICGFRKQTRRIKYKEKLYSNDSNIIIDTNENIEIILSHDVEDGQEYFIMVPPYGSNKVRIDANGTYYDFYRFKDNLYLKYIKCVFDKAHVEGSISGRWFIFEKY
jgi:hypothetical protein